VQSDSSFIGWEKDDCRFKLTDLSVEGILHAVKSIKVAHVKEYLDIMETKGQKLFLIFKISPIYPKWGKKSMCPYCLCLVPGRKVALPRSTFSSSV
jgi:hypothetical protein